VGQWKLGRMITRLMTSECSAKEAGHKVRYQLILPNPLSPRMQVASKLPRSQQKKIAAVLEAFVNQHSDREA
jgi:hypothetical protein